MAGMKRLIPLMIVDSVETPLEKAHDKLMLVLAETDKCCFLGRQCQLEVDL